MARIPKSIKSTGQILQGPNHILHSLYAQSRKLSEIDATVRPYIDENFAVSSFKNNELTLITPSGAIATRIRYRQRNIISSLRQSGLDVDRLKIKVDPNLPLPEPAAVERHLPATAAAQLRETARHIKDKPLRNALNRLAERNSDQA